MNTELKLTKNMSVYANDNEKVGDVKHIVVEPTTSEVTHLIVEQGFILTNDKVLPLDYIARQDEGALYLNRSSDGLDLLDYKESFFVSRHNPEFHADENGVESDVTSEPQSVYYYPPLPYHGVGGYYWGLPSSLVVDPVQEVVLENVPAGSIVIEEGTDVYSLDDDHVGDVYEVHIDRKTNRITHFIISQGLIFHDYKLIPVFWVGAADDDRVTVGVTTEQLKSLPSYEPDTA